MSAQQQDSFIARHGATPIAESVKGMSPLDHVSYVTAIPFKCNVNGKVLNSRIHPQLISLGFQNKFQHPTAGSVVQECRKL